MAGHLIAPFYYQVHETVITYGPANFFCAMNNEGVGVLNICNDVPF